MSRIIEKLNAAGITVSVADGKLRLTPKEKLTPELVEEIKQNKAEIVGYLKEFGQVDNMTLKKFARKNLAVKIYSGLLGKAFWLVSNGKVQNQVKNKGLVTYLPHELAYLMRMKPNQDDLGKIHLLKEVFPGSEIK